MRVKLNVPYAEKDQAKRLGAKWDPTEKVWFVTDSDNLWSFLKWMPKYLSQPSQSSKASSTVSTYEKIAEQRSKKAAKDRAKKQNREAKEAVKKNKREEAKNTHFIAGPITPRTDFSMFDPGCSCVPWEWCEHNPEPANPKTAFVYPAKPEYSFDVAPEHLAHIRSILAE